MSKKKVASPIYGEDEVVETKVSSDYQRKWSGLPTPNGKFLCYSSSVMTEYDAELAVIALMKQDKDAWFEYDKETRKYVVKFAK